MAVDGEGCEVDPADERCVQSINYDESDYENNQKCTITNPPAVPISVEAFAVEDAPKGVCYDFLTVNGARYCGTEGPESIVPDGSPIEWLSDKIDTAAGWKLCFPPSTKLNGD